MVGKILFLELPAGLHQYLVECSDFRLPCLPTIAHTEQDALPEKSNTRPSRVALPGIKEKQNTERKYDKESGVGEESTGVEKAVTLELDGLEKKASSTFSELAGEKEKDTFSDLVREKLTIGLGIEDGYVHSASVLNKIGGQEVDMSSYLGRQKLTVELGVEDSGVHSKTSKEVGMFSELEKELRHEVDTFSELEEDKLAVDLSMDDSANVLDSFGMNKKKSHEVHRFSRLIAQVMARNQLTQVNSICNYMVGCKESFVTLSLYMGR